MSGSASAPFDLLRWFTKASFGVILVMALGAGLASAVLVRAVFLHMEADEADSLGEYFVTEFAAAGYDRSSWGRVPIPVAARSRALADMRNFDVAELRLLSRGGRPLETLVASGRAPSDVWEYGLAEAREGRVALRWEDTSGLVPLLLSTKPSGTLETYAPVREGGGVAAVVKVRRDLGAVVATTRKTLLAIVGLSAAAGIAIFGALTLLVRRADATLRWQHRAISAARASLEERNRRLEEVDRKKDEFYAACGHDLRGPLLSAHAGARLLLADPEVALTALHREILEDARRSVEGVLELIGNLLAAARAEALADDLELERLDLAALLRGVIAAHRTLAAARGIPISGPTAEDAVWIVGDRLKLVRVFSNLLFNAIKHAGGKPIRVAVASSPEGARVTVKDEGTGIPPEVRARLFRPFARGRGEAEDGAGLGLAIVRDFVARHGGSVRFESEPGRGTVFVVEFPGAEERAAPVREAV